jgi:hypothetical protein
MMVRPRAGESSKVRTISGRVTAEVVDIVDVVAVVVVGGVAAGRAQLDVATPTTLSAATICTPRRRMALIRC